MKKIIATLLATASLLSLAACGSPSGNNAPADTKAPAGTTAPAGTSAPANDSTEVVIGYVGLHAACYPSSNSNDFIQQAMVYDKLFEVDDNTGEYTSRTLSSWEWKDGTTFVMTLKDGMTFSDGKPVTGEDVLFSLQDYVTNGAAPRTDKYPYYQFIDFDKCSVSDDGLTVTVVWQKEYGPAYRQMNCAIMEKEFTQAHDIADMIWYTGPVGSGPYKITECVQDSYVVFELRDDYWNKDYTYDATKITLKFYSDETAMYVDYQNGNLDAIYGISSTVAQQIEAAGNQGTVQYISNKDVTLLNLNDQTPALQDPAVREAIAYALDMNAIAGIAYGTLATPAKSHFASDFPFYTEHEGYTYDVAKAKQILADAGYKDGDIMLTCITTNNNPDPQIGEAIQGYLGAVGIQVSVSSYDLPTALGMYMDGQSDLTTLSTRGGNGTLEPYQVISGIDATASFQCMANHDPEFNALLDVGLNSVDEDTRWDAYAKADQWLYDNFHSLPVCETMGAIAYNSRITSFNQGTVGKGCLGALTLG